MVRVAYLVNENNGRRYHLETMMRIGAPEYPLNNIQLRVPIDFDLRIYYGYSSSGLLLYGIGNGFRGHVKINGVLVEDQGYGFRETLCDFDSFSVNCTNFRVYILRGNESLIERTVFNGKLLPMARVLPNRR